jgi:hypothetical protein
MVCLDQEKSGNPGQQLGWKNKEGKFNETLKQPLALTWGPYYDRFV